MCLGKNISSKMEDLRNMTLALGIQVDNPISILDQNTARHFLNQNKPSDKFDLFMRATNLETLQNMFVEIAMYLDKTKQELGKKERVSPDTIPVFLMFSCSCILRNILYCSNFLIIMPRLKRLARSMRWY